MNKAPHITVGMSIYNTSPDLIKRAIDSVKCQTYQNYDLVIIDNASVSTQTVQYLESLNDDNIKVITLKENIGPGGGRNAVIEHAKGEFVCFLDSDDFIHQNHLSSAKNIILENPNVDMILCGYCIVDSEGNELQRVPARNAMTSYTSYATTAPWNRIVRLDFLKKNRIQFPQGCLTEDMIYIAQCNYYAKEIFYTGEYTYYNLYNPKSTSRSDEFKSVTVNQLPFRELHDIITKNKEGKNDKILWGQIVEQVCLIGCVMSRNSEHTSYDLILANCIELINEVPHLLHIVFRWSCRSETNNKLKIIMSIIAIGGVFHCEKRAMQDIRMILRKLMK